MDSFVQKCLRRVKRTYAANNPHELLFRNLYVGLMIRNAFVVLLVLEPRSCVGRQWPSPICMEHVWNRMKNEKTQVLLELAIPG